MTICSYPMASISLKLLFLVCSFFLLAATSAQVLYDDEPTLEQFSPMLGENFIEYPMLEEYGVPSVEEFPDEGPYEDYQEDNQENEFTAAENRDKKDFVNNADNEHAQKTPSALNSKIDAREKRQLPLQDDPVEIARGKLERALKAAQALTNIEKELGLNPSTIENKTAKLESELKGEEKTFKQMEDKTHNASKKAEFVKLEKDVDDDMNNAQNILKLIVNLEAAKFLAKQRAQDDLEKAEKRKLASSPPMILGQPVAYPPPTSGYFGGVQQPAYQPMVQSYIAGYQPQMYQGMSAPSVASSPNSMLSTAVSPYQSAYQDDLELQRINSIKATEASASLLPFQHISQQPALETTAPQTVKMANLNTHSVNIVQRPAQPKKPTTENPIMIALNPQPGSAHAQPSNDHKVPQLQAKPKQNKEPTSMASPPSKPVQPVKPAMPGKPVFPARPAAPLQPVSPSAQTIEAAFVQSNGLVPQAAPLTASYNPSVVSPTLSSMSRYLESPVDTQNLIAMQSFSRPVLPQTQQAIVPFVQPKRPNLKEPELAKPLVTSTSAAVNEQPQTFSNPIHSARLQSSSPAAYSGEQALSAAYPSNSYYAWNSQAFPSSNPEFGWNTPTFYRGSTAPYQTPVNPLLTEAYLKLQDTERASLAMSKIEEAIGLSPSSVKSIIDDIETRAKQEEKEYEDDMNKEKAKINKEKALLQSDEHVTGDGAKTKIKEDEAKLRDDIRKENVAKSEVDKVKKIEKILTIIEAAKYSAMQRAKNKISKLQGVADEGLDGGQIRKRDLEDLEKDMRRRRRNEINIWLKGSRNHIDTSHFLRNQLHKLEKNRERSSRWGTDGNKLGLLNHLETLNEKRMRGESTNDEPRTSIESPLHRLKFFKTLVSNKKLDSGKQFAVSKRTNVQEKPKSSVDNFIMAKMLEKMDKLYKMQENILKYLKTEHDMYRLQDKSPTKRWRRSLYHSKHHKRIHKRDTKNKIHHY